MRVAVTGAAGFIGRAVVARLRAGPLGSLALLRLNDLHADAGDGTWVSGSFAEPAVRAALLDGGVDLLFHLASLPGGAAEADFTAGRLVNLDGTLALFDAAAGGGCVRVVYTSSIAALDMAGPVGPATPLRPATSYGAHKAMAELYLADLTRRGALDGRSVRPAGIVARPTDRYAGFATAWMSDIFRVLARGGDIAVPLRANARVWLQSVAMLADNLLHAARLPAADLPPHRAWTLPATRVRVDALADAIRAAAGHGGTVRYGDLPMDQPPLDASDALAAGFASDGEVNALVARVFAQMREETG